MSPATFRLRSPPAKDYPVQRPMDGLTINAFSPQEDEFALLALGIPSVYRGFFDPGRLPELTRWLDPDVWTNKPPAGWPAAWLEFLTGVMDGKAGRLVLKSPNHTFRLDTLIRLFPNAHYVWLVRDPIATFFSNRKMWLAMFERYALWPWNVSILDDFLTQTFMLAAECLGRASRILPRERLVVVQFDELTSATLDTLSRINHRLHIGNWDEIRPALLGPATAKAGYRHDTYNEGDLPASTRPAIERLRLTQSAALTSHGL